MKLTYAYRLKTKQTRKKADLRKEELITMHQPSLRITETLVPHIPRRNTLLPVDYEGVLYISTPGSGLASLN